MAILRKNLAGASDTLAPEPLPEGWYRAHATETKLSYTKSNNTQLEIRWTVLEGPKSGRSVYDRIQLEGSEQAVRFGEVKLKTIARCVGHPNPNWIEDSDELLQKPCRMLVGVRTWEGKDRNQINDYESERAWLIRFGGGNGQPGGDAPGNGGGRPVPPPRQAPPVPNGNGQPQGPPPRPTPPPNGVPPAPAAQYSPPPNTNGARTPFTAPPPPNGGNGNPAPVFVDVPLDDIAPEAEAGSAYDPATTGETPF